jgi:hypothetical protein
LFFLSLSWRGLMLLFAAARICPRKSWRRSIGWRSRKRPPKNLKS